MILTNQKYTYISRSRGNRGVEDKLLGLSSAQLLVQMFLHCHCPFGNNNTKRKRSPILCAC